MVEVEFAGLFLEGDGLLGSVGSVGALHQFFGGHSKETSLERVDRFAQHFF